MVKLVIIWVWESLREVGWVWEVNVKYQAVKDKYQMVNIQGGIQNIYLPSLRLFKVAIIIIIV